MLDVFISLSDVLTCFLTVLICLFVVFRLPLHVPEVHRSFSSVWKERDARNSEQLGREVQTLVSGTSLLLRRRLQRTDVDLLLPARSQQRPAGAINESHALPEDWLRTYVRCVLFTRVRSTSAGGELDLQSSVNTNDNNHRKKHHRSVKHIHIASRHVESIHSIDKYHQF